MLDMKGVTSMYGIRLILKEDSEDTVVEKILSWVFNIIILITMFLCFFSVSTAMSANIYD